MNNQAQVRRNARGTTLPSSRSNLYNSHSVSVSSVRFFQKFDQMMFPSPKQDKSLKATSISKDSKDMPKDFQVEIEERFEQVSSRRSYSFPRQNPEKREGAEIQKTTSSDSSNNSMKHATVYNLYSQNPGGYTDLEGPQIPSILLLAEEKMKQKNNNVERKVINIDKVETSMDKEPISKKAEENKESAKQFNENNAPSSFRKLVSLIEVQLNKTSDKPSETPKDIMQQTWAKTWLGMMSSSSRKANKTLHVNTSGLSQTSCAAANENKKFLNSSTIIEEPEPAIKKSQTRDIDKIGKSSYYLRASSRQQEDSKNIREAKSNKMLSNQDSNTTNTSAKSTYLKVLGVKNLNVSTRPLSNWDFSLVKSPNYKRSVSPETNTTVINANRITLKVPNKEEKPKPGPIKILDEEDQRRFFEQQAKALNIRTEKRSKENNLSLIPDIQEEKTNKETRKRKPGNSFCHFPENDFNKLLKAGFVSPARNMSKDSAPRLDVPKSPVTKVPKKRLQSQNMENRPAKQEKSQVNISNEHKKKKSLERVDSSKKDQRNSSPKNKNEKLKGSQDTPLVIQYGKPQQYSLFPEEDGRKEKEIRHKTPTNMASKSNILKNLFMNRVKK